MRALDARAFSAHARRAAAPMLADKSAGENTHQKFAIVRRSKLQGRVSGLKAELTAQLSDAPMQG